MIRTILRELFGLFVDDRFLAVATLVVIALSAATAWLLSPAAAGIVLFLGCLTVLAEDIFRTARARPAQ